MNKISFPENTTLVLMCKRPQFGRGKQRLAATLGKSQAMDIAKGLLDCALEDANYWRGPLVYAVAHEEDMAWAQKLLPGNQRVLSQGSGNLGERINFVDRQLRHDGHNKLVFIGTDAPMLKHMHYQHAQENLMRHDVVLIPASDGGVVIMANALPWPNLKHLSWSTDKLGNELTLCCQNHQLNTINILSGYDIDEENHLYRLREDLISDNRPARKILLEILNRSIKQIEEARRA